MKKYIILGHIYFAILIVFSIIFYLERTLYVDSAYQIYQLINTGNFHINDNRFSMFLSELLPLSFIHLDLGLRKVILSYSLSFVLLFYAFYILVVHLLKNYKAGILITLIIIGIRHTFFHTISETFQVLTFATFFFAWLYYPLKIKNKILNTIIFLAVSLLSVALCFFIHPITIFIIPFIIGYYVIDQKKWKDYKMYVIVLLFFLLYVLKYLTIKENTREGDFVGELLNFTDVINNFFTFFSTQYLKIYFFPIYIYPTIILLIVTVFYFYKKEFLKLIFLYVFSILFFIISCVVYNEGGSDIEMERIFMPLIFFITIPFVNEIIPSFKKLDYVKFGLIILFLLISFRGIYIVSQKYTSRLSAMIMMVEMVEKYPEKKFVLELKPEDKPNMMAHWALSMETLLYSSILGPEYSKTIFLTEDFTDVPAKFYKQDSLFFAVPWWVDWSVNELNSKYFILPQQKYQQIVYNYVPKYLCTADKLNSTKDKMISEITEGLLYNDAKLRTTNRSYSGDYSVELDKENIFGLTCNLHSIKADEIYKISVKRYIQGESFIVVSCEKPKFYLQNKTSTKIDSTDWELVELEFTVPKRLDGKEIKCYIWNSNQDSVYFDDFTIYRRELNKISPF